MSDNDECTLYCEGTVHAVLVTAPACVTHATFERWAVWSGYVLHEARHVLEADLATVLAKSTWTWNAVTEELTPYRSTDALPTDEVWMVRISLAPCEQTTVHMEGPVVDRRWKRCLDWWRMVLHG
jgi:hypothetical protein